MTATIGLPPDGGDDSSAWQVSAIRVTNLSLTHFRNYASQDFKPADGVTVLTGDNGQGKTNLLESLFILATGHSHRADTDREVIGWSAAREPIPYSRIAADVTAGDGTERKLELVMQLAPRGQVVEPPAVSERTIGPSGLRGGTLQKGYKVNGVRQRSVSSVGDLAVVLAGPEEVDLFAGPPADRRRAIDSTALQTDGEYARELRRYERLVTQRNAALRDARERGATQRTEDMRLWEQELIRAGSFVLGHRITMIDVLQKEMLAAHAEFTGRTGHLALEYRSTVANGEDEDASSDLQQSFAAALEGAWGRDSATATTSVGPHRDDLRVVSGDVDLGVYGSRGQQRTAALALVIAQSAYIGQRLGDEPVILLDDPLSELDADRRERVLKHCLTPGRQVLITTADVELIPAEVRAHAVMYAVKSGKIERA